MCSRFVCAGWILDVIPVSEGMGVWIIDTDGQAQFLIDSWSPHFYLAAEPGSEDQLRKILHSFKTPIDIEVTEKKDFFSGKSQTVLRVTVKNPLLFSSVVHSLRSLAPFQLFDADVPLGQYYFYERGSFPLARCDFEVDEENRIQSWRLQDDRLALIYDLPPLRYVHLELECPTGNNVWVNPAHRPRNRFILTLGPNREQGTSYAMESSEEDLIRSLNRRLNEWDPDILISEGGDDYLFHRLQFHSERVGVPLQFSRNPKPSPWKSVIQGPFSQRKWALDKDIPGRRNKGHSFMTFGKMVYQPGARTLFGRLHIDRRNSFTVGHTGLHGLFEIARMAKIPIQRAARCTIGSSLSSMQHEWAVQHNVLIPVDKGQTEDFRSADEFIASDRGGLVYEPEIGFHEDVIEFDFSSMYPEIMIRHNVTPEAVNCLCCLDNVVPGLRHHLCRQQGMIPDVLRPIVHKRTAYKKMMRNGHVEAAVLKERYDAFKWALVTCFGYLGFRNARFGRIEAHECVNAYGREALLQAKEVAEAAGFHFIHAIVDSMWLKKEGATDEQVEDLRKKIETVTNLPLGLEGRYRWIRFCESKQKKGVGVPNRYFGVFTNGELKFRGIELRRRDTPLLVKSLQQEMLALMSTAKNLAELRDLQSQLEEILNCYLERLRCGQVTPQELAISRQLRQRPEDYLHDTLPALAAKKMAACGIELHPGETISYIVTEEKDKIKDWRVMPLAFVEEAFEYDEKYYRKILKESFQYCFSNSRN